MREINHSNGPMMKKISLLILALFIAFPVYAKNPFPKDGWIKPYLQYSPYAVAVMAGAGIVGYVGNRWWQGEASEKLHERAAAVHKELDEKYSNFRGLSADIVRSYDEQRCSQLFTPEIIQVKNIHAYRGYCAPTDAKRLQAIEADLIKRIARDGKKNLPIIEKIKDLLVNVQALNTQFQKMDAFWKVYAPYYTARQTVSRIENAYDRARKNATNKRIIKKELLGTGVNFPFVAYAQKVKKDLLAVNAAIDGSRNYPLLNRAAKSIRNDLQEILATVVGMSEYAADQHNKREHERIEAEKERLRIERMTILAQEAANALERSRIAALHAQAKADRQKAKTERERAEADRKKAEADKAQAELEKERLAQQLPPAAPPQPSMSSATNPEYQPSAPPVDSNYPGLYPSYNGQTGEFVNPPSAPSGNYPDLHGVNLYG